MLVVYRNLLGESHPATGEHPEGMLGRRSGRVGGELLLSPQSVEIIKFGDPGSGR